MGPGLLPVGPFLGSSSGCPVWESAGRRPSYETRTNAGLTVIQSLAGLSFHVCRWCDQPVQYIREYHVDIDLAERSDDSIFPEIPKAIGSLCKEFERYGVESLFFAYNDFTPVVSTVGNFPY
jgi:hypothetical protein